MCPGPNGVPGFFVPARKSDCFSIVFNNSQAFGMHPFAETQKVGRGWKRQGATLKLCAGCMAPALSITTVLCIWPVFSGNHGSMDSLGHVASEGLRSLPRAAVPPFRHPPAANQIIANRSGWKLL
jgi:hypothetical protein